MDEVSFSRGEESQGITIKRGGQDVVLKKVPDTFAVRLKRGMAMNETALQNALGQPKTPVTHVSSDLPERLSVFSLGGAGPLEETMDELRQASNAEVVTHVYTMSDEVDKHVIPTGTITIQFNSNTAPSRQEEILKAYGLEILEDVDFLPNTLVVSLTSASKLNPLKIAAELDKLAEVDLAEPDLRVPASFGYRPTDTLYPDQWHLKNRGDKVGLKAGADVKAEEAWDTTKGSREIRICIIDDGFDMGHPDFNAPDKIVAPRNFAQNNTDPSPASFNDNHGTACAGVALAEERGGGVVGLAPHCALMPVRFENITDRAIVNWFQYAIDNEADVISCSWAAAPAYYPLSTLQAGIIHKAASEGRKGKGCVILFAAGNESRPLNGSGSYQGFALHPDVIAVAASNSKDEHADYSNFGPEIAICAPSSGSPGRKILTTDRRGFNGYNPGSDYTYSFGGTSSATPLAAGLAALILTVNPDLTAAHVKQIMMETADKIDPDGGDYDSRGHSPLYGHGRINAHRAVQRAKDMRSQGAPRLLGGGEMPTPADVQLAIVGVELAQIDPASTAREKLLEVKTAFRLSGAESLAALADKANYRVDVYIVNGDSGKTDLVAQAAGELQPQTAEYTSRSQFVLPADGSYQLRSHVVLQLPSGELEQDRTSETTLLVKP